MQMHLSEIESVTGKTAETDDANQAGPDETGHRRHRPVQEDCRYQILKFSTEIYLFLPGLYLNTCMIYEYISMR